jgi:hypothetical protein
MGELTPEYYGDVYSIRSSPWGVAMTFSVAAPKDDVEGHDVCIVRLSHATAKTLSMMLRKQLRQYERDTKTAIAVPPDVMNQLGLAPEDW